MDDIGAEQDKIGLAGSPTQVHKVNMVVLETTETRTYHPPAPAS